MNTNGEFAKKKWPWPIGNYHLGICLYQTVAWNLRRSRRFLRRNQTGCLLHISYFISKIDWQLSVTTVPYLVAETNFKPQPCQHQRRRQSMRVEAP